MGVASIFIPDSVDPAVDPRLESKGVTQMPVFDFLVMIGGMTWMATMALCVAVQPWPGHGPNGRA